MIPGPGQKSAGSKSLVNNLQSQQRKILKEILNLNTEVNDLSTIEQSEWKVLIYDKKGEEILAPHLGVKELREFGITLYLNLECPKEPIPGISAIYLCCPSEENIKLIAK
ncbi:MAG: Sec1 domain containing protein 1, partial [Paramarteilia canceri]